MALFARRQHDNGAERPPTPVAGGHLRLGTSATGGAWQVVTVISNLQSSVLRSLILEPLAFIGPGQEVQTTVFETLQLSEDAKVISFTLRDGLRFGPHARCFAKGRPATVDDVEASLTAERQALLALATDIERVERVDERTGRIVLARPNRSALWSLRVAALVPHEFFEGACDDARSLASPVGSGPFRVLPSSHPQRIDLEVSNREHPEAPRHLDRVSIIHFSTRELCFEALEQGAVDLCRAQSARYPLDHRPLQAPWDQKLSELRHVELRQVSLYALN